MADARPNLRVPRNAFRGRLARLRGGPTRPRPYRNREARRGSSPAVGRFGKATAALVDFEVTLSRSMPVAVFDLGQQRELPMTISVPPLAEQNRASFGDDFLGTSGRFFRVETRWEAK